MQAQTVRSTNIHGEEIVTQVTTQFEREKFLSKTDWRMRAISASRPCRQALFFYFLPRSFPPFSFPFVSNSGRRGGSGASRSSGPGAR